MGKGFENRVKSVLKKGATFLSQHGFHKSNPISMARSPFSRYSCPIIRFPKLKFDVINSAANDLLLSSLFGDVVLTTSFNIEVSCYFFRDHFVLSQLKTDTDQLF